MFSVFLSVPPPPGQGPEGAPLVKVGSPPVQVKVWGAPRSRSWSRSGGGAPPGQGPGQGLGGTPRSWSRSKNAKSAGGIPLAVTQEDCLVTGRYTCLSVRSQGDAGGGGGLGTWTSSHPPAQHHTCHMPHPTLNLPGFTCLPPPKLPHNCHPNI